MADLKTNYKDDVLDTSKNQKRKYKMIQNPDGTVSFEDVTVYTQEGDSFGGADINATNKFCNLLNQGLINKSNTNHVHDDRYYIKAQIDAVTSGSAQRINNSYIDAVSLSWYKNGKIVWITGTISVSKAIPAGAAFFFASGFPSRLKQLLGTAICYTGDPAGQHQRGSFYTYIEGDKLSCYGGGALETAPGAYTLNAFYILD